MAETFTLNDLHNCVNISLSEPQIYEELNSVIYIVIGLLVCTSSFSIKNGLKQTDPLPPLQTQLCSRICY